MDGWIKLHRKLLSNPIVCKDSDHLSVWIYLLLNATHTEHPALFSGQRITLNPGQLITGRKSIASEQNISESKVQRILNCFENEHQIEQQTSNKNRLITILSWHRYQISEQQNEHQVNNNRTTTEQQVNTNKKERTKESNNKDKKEYADYVFLTETEYGKLSELLGDELESYFLRYGSWISGQSAKVQKSRSAYLTIRNWHNDRPTRGSSTVGRTGQAAKVTPIKPNYAMYADERNYDPL